MQEPSTLGTRVLQLRVRDISFEEMIAAMYSDPLHRERKDASPMPGPLRRKMWAAARGQWIAVLAEPLYGKCAAGPAFLVTEAERRKYKSSKPAWVCGHEVEID